MKSLKNNGKSRRGAAIELAIFALALMTVFGALAVSITVSETKYIKEDKAELSAFVSQLEDDEKVKIKLINDISRISDFIQSETEMEYIKSVDGFKHHITYKLGLDGKIRIISWERTTEDE